MMDYRGWSYEQCSREGARLLAKANETGNWWAIIDSLTELRRIMKMQMRHEAA